MSDRMRDSVHDYLSLDCARLGACVAQAVECAAAAEASGARAHVAELSALALRHVRVGENLLPPRAARALRHDHHRLTQLVTAAQLALDGGELDRAVRSLRTLGRFIEAHEARERPFLG